MDAEDEARRMMREDERTKVEEAERQRRLAYQRPTPEERRRNALEDIPQAARKRSLPPEEPQGVEEDAAEQRFKSSLFTYVQNVVMEDELAERLRTKTQTELRKESRKNEGR